MNSQNLRAAGCVAIVLALIALAVPKLRSQSSDEKSERFQRTFNIGPNGTLEVDNYKGTIHVTGSDTNQVVVDVTKRFEGSDADRKWWMENLQINFHNDSSRVAIEVKYPSVNCIFCWMDHNYTSSVELEIRVPRQINVKLDSYKPDIKVASIQGEIRIKSYKSPIALDSTTGAVRIDTYKETIKLNNVNIRGPLDVRSYKADTEILASSLGDYANLETYKGSIELRVPGNAGLDVDFDGGRRASFHTDFPLATRSSYDHNVRGRINQGGTRLRIRTERGDVSLQKL